MRDWYDYMSEWESMNPYHKNYYLIDAGGGLIRLYNARDGNLVGRFTVEQMGGLFRGLCFVGDSNDKGTDVYDSQIQRITMALENAGVDWRVYDNGMTIREEYCYVIGMLLNLESE